MADKKNNNQIIDCDVQNETSTINVRAGIENLKVMMKIDGYTLPTNIAIIATTNLTRGVHMSRLVNAAFENLENKHFTQNMLDILTAVNATQKEASVRCEFEYPFKDVFVHIVVLLKNNTFTYMFNAPGITACPCSKKMVGIGHMQRAWLSIAFTQSGQININEILEKMFECFSTTTTEFMKRPQEGQKVLDSQNNPKFVEDAVRDAAIKFPQAYLIKARSEESIHMHDAVAYISRSTNCPKLTEEECCFFKI